MNVVEVRSGSFQVTVNNSSHTIEYPFDSSSLFGFINDLREGLHYDKIEIIRELPKKYGLRSSKLIYLVSEKLFPELFTELVIQCGINSMINGTRFSRKSFCNLISPFNSIYLGLQINELSLIDNAIDKLQDQIINTFAKAFAEKEYTIVQKLIKSLTIGPFFDLIWRELQEPFKCYINEAAKELFNKDKEITCHGIWNLCIRRNRNQRYVNAVKHKPQNDFILQVVNTWRQKQDNQKRKLRMNIGDVHWNIPYEDIQNIRTTKIDFSKMNSYLLCEVQKYLLSWRSKGENGISIARRFHHMSALTNAINVAQMNIQSFLDITYAEVFSIIDVLHQFKNNSGKRKYGVKTIHTQISEARLLFDWLRVEKNNESIKNPFRRFKMNNVDSFVKNTNHIPEYVVQQISSAIHDCSETVQRIWLILMNTGMRASEIINLQEDCLFYNNQDKCYYLKAESNKTLNSRRKKGLDDYHTLPITNDELVEIIHRQIKETEQLRQVSNSKYIFIREANDNRLTDNTAITRFTGNNISSSINRCILRNNITDHNGALWHYTNHQCRKTMGVRLLSEGSSIQDVSVILGHLEEKTTRQYYQDIDNLKIAKLDQELFELLFENMELSIRNTYSTQELESLKYEIMIGSRETPEGHGSCLKHVSFGPCKKKSCVGCSLLLTGPQKLTMWKKLRDEQLDYLESLTNSMKDQGIGDYNNYRDHQQEVHLLNLYQDTIDKIEKFIQERIPNYAST